MASVSFSANDTGVSSFMEKMKRQSMDMTSQLLKDAEKQKLNAKETLQYLEDRIKAEQRLSQLNSQTSQQAVKSWVKERQERSVTQLDSFREHIRQQRRSGAITDEEYSKRLKRFTSLRENYSQENIVGRGQEQIRLLRDQAKNSEQLSKYMLENVRATRAAGQEGARLGPGSVEGRGLGSQSEELARQFARETVREEKKHFFRERASRAWDVARGITIEKTLSLLSQTPNAKNELDLIRPVGNAMGAAAGTLLFMPMLGTKIGEVAGTTLERHLRSKDAYEQAYYGTSRLSGVRGLDTVSDTYSNIGISMTQAEQKRLSYTSAKGSLVSDVGANSELRAILGLEGGYGVSSGALSSMYSLSRSNATGDRNTPAIIAGIKEAVFGQGDRSFLNEFLTRNYAQLQKTLIATQDYVNTGTTVSIIKGLSSLGGAWSMKDERSSGLSNQLQQSLSNPGSDAAKALAFTIMRQSNPEMSLLDTQMEIQKGMGSSKYLQSMLGFITSQGGDESYQVNNVASFFGLEGNLSAAKRLVSGYKSGTLPSQFSQGRMSGDTESAYSEARGFTTQFSESTAYVDNEYIKGATEGFKATSEKLLDAFDIMFKGVVNEVAKRMGAPTFYP